VKVSGVDDVMRTLRPLLATRAGERIVGFITRGPVSPSSVDCRASWKSDPQRRVEVAWDGAAGQFSVRCRSSVLHRLAGAPRRHEQGDQRDRHQHLTGAGCARVPDKRALNTFELMIDSVDAAEPGDAQPRPR